MNKLTIWLLVLPYVYRWGSSRLRKALTDLIIWLLPDDNPKRMKRIFEIIEANSQEIYQDRKASYQEHDVDEQGRKSMVDLLCGCGVLF